MKLPIHQNFGNTFDLKYTIQNQKIYSIGICNNTFLRQLHVTQYRACYKRAMHILSVGCSPFQKMSSMLNTRVGRIWEAAYIAMKFKQCKYALQSISVMKKWRVHIYVLQCFILLCLYSECRKSESKCHCAVHIWHLYTLHVWFNTGRKEKLGFKHKIYS